MLRVHYKDERAVERLGSSIGTWLCRQGAKEVIVVAIGTDRSTGDALGPLVGSKLVVMRERGLFVGEVLGTLEEPVHAENLSEVAWWIEARTRGEGGPKVIAVDASLGDPDIVGTIAVRRGPVQAGAGLGRRLPVLGDLTVTGCVNIGARVHTLNELVLRSTRLSMVMAMANVIAHAIVVGVGMSTGRAVAFEAAVAREVR